MKGLYILLLFFLSFEANIFAQTTLFSENFGITAALPTVWASSNAANGWAAVTSSVSSGYTGASGGTNMIFNGTGPNGNIHTLTYNNNLTTVGYTGITVLWAGRGATSFNSNITFEWSINGTLWNSVSYSYSKNANSWALVNSGTAITLPIGAEGAANLQLRWSAAAANSGNYRIDDIKVQGTPSVASTASFTTSSGSVLENAGTYNIGVTVNTAPASTLVLRVADAGTGTASPSTDYAFTTTDLTFLSTDVYPKTQYATVTIKDDAIPEANKYTDFILSKVSGPAITLSTVAHRMTIIDDDAPRGVILNEFSQGANNASYLELVVIGSPGTTADLRGWIIDDNSGIFSGGYGTQLGIADGHIKFSNSCTWEKVPVGAIIVIYAIDQTGSLPIKNGKITALGLADDPTDANLDYVYVVGVNLYNSTKCNTAASNNYFSSDCNLPNNSSYDTYTPATYVNPDMGTILFRNGGDAVQIRDAAGTYYMGLSYGSKGTSPVSTCGGCQFNAANHPDYATYGANALYFSGTSNVTYAFQNTNTNDFRDVSNWTKTTTSSPNALETPGVANNAANQTWINSLRGNFEIVTDNQSYTCQLRQYESRYYLDAVDNIIFYIKNNANINHGTFTAQTIIHNVAATGKGFQNSNLTGTPLFMQKTFAATPTNYTTPNYKIKCFVSTQELQDYCDYINPILNALPGYYTAHHYTPATVVPHLKIYKTATTDRAWTVTSDAQVEIKNPVIGAYTSYAGNLYYTFEYDGFTGFSGYALGDIVTPDIGLPVELTSFHAKCISDNVTLDWATASEQNSDYFEVERSNDAVHFTALSQIPAAGNSNSIKMYSYTDRYPENGQNYYRLKQQDKGSKPATYSSIVQTSCEQDIKNQWQVFYTPENGIKVQIQSDKEENFTWMLFEVSGKLLLKENKEIPQGMSLFELPVNPKLAAGIYLLQAIGETSATAKKILVY